MKTHETDAHKWTAVQTRDAASDGAFVYAVSTTQIYCLPSCSSRLAKREHVTFFETPLAAEAAGFRACKRCRPDQQLRHPHAQAIRQACEAIHTAEDEPDLAQLAQSAGLSPSHFQRVFKAEVGLSPKRYAMAVRKQRLRQELPSARSVTHAMYDAGYTSPARAYADENALGMTPSAYLKGAKGETIRYAAAHTSFGNILIAATTRGLCMVEFGAKSALMITLKSRFPLANLVPADAALNALVAQVVERIDAPCQSTALPLDLRGTAFQERVWQALTGIPVGETVSYAELANRIGQPKAARAVAKACATNPIAVIVPCHRVVRGTGEISGYKWGVERKRKLLDQEAAKRRDEHQD